MICSICWLIIKCIFPSTFVEMMSFFPWNNSFKINKCQPLNFRIFRIFLASSCKIDVPKYHIECDCLPVWIDANDNHIFAETHTRTRTTNNYTAFSYSCSCQNIQLWFYPLCVLYSSNKIFYWKHCCRFHSNFIRFDDEPKIHVMSTIQ